MADEAEEKERTPPQIESLAAASTRHEQELDLEWEWVHVEHGTTPSEESGPALTQVLRTRPSQMVK